MRKSNLTYEELIELAPKDRPFQIEVIFRSVSELPISYWAMINGKKLKTFWLEDFNWENSYNELFTLIDEYRNMYEKPEVLEVGTKVEILESILDTLGENEDLPVGKVSTIQKVVENNHGLKYRGSGLKYRIESWLVPHYCVRPVEKVEKVEEIITVNGKKYKLIEE
jgi:hypothetical protein